MSEARYTSGESARTVAHFATFGTEVRVGASTSIAKARASLTKNVDTRLSSS